MALVVCGGIAAYRTPDLCRALRREGAELVVYCTPSALEFVTPLSIEWTALSAPIVQLGGRAEHVEVGAIDLWLVAPATYSSINKLAAGIADNAALTALAGALGGLVADGTPMLIAPAMHGSMVNRILRDSLARLTALGVDIIAPRGRDGKALLPEVEDLVSHVVAATSSDDSAAQSDPR